MKLKTNHKFEHVVRHIPGGVADGSRRRVREDDRRLRRLQRVAHRLGRRVAQVDQHAEPIHLAHHRLAEVGEADFVAGRAHAPAVVAGAALRAARPRRVARVRQRQVARAQVVQHAQHREAVAERMSALHADQAGNLARAVRILQI